MESAKTGSDSNGEGGEVCRKVKEEETTEEGGERKRRETARLLDTPFFTITDALDTDNRHY